MISIVRKNLNAWTKIYSVKYLFVKIGNTYSIIFEETGCFVFRNAARVNNFIIFKPLTLIICVGT